MIAKHRLLIVVIVSLIPILLALQIGNAVQCKGLTQGQFESTDWYKTHEKGTQEQFEKECNEKQPLIYILLIPASPILGIVTYIGMKKEDDYTKSHESNGELK